MRHVIALTVVLIAAVALAGGCQNKKKNGTATAGNSLSPSVTDITPSAPAPAPVAYQPAPQPAMTSDISVTSTPSAGATGGGGSYTVKKGDTLYGIARAKYGDGKQYTKIVAANPGVSPQSLKVGQTLVIP